MFSSIWHEFINDVKCRILGTADVKWSKKNLTLQFTVENCRIQFGYPPARVAWNIYRASIVSDPKGLLKRSGCVIGRLKVIVYNKNVLII